MSSMGKLQRELKLQFAFDPHVAMIDRENYYRFHRVFSSIVGAWPYQNRTTNYVALMVYFLVAGSQFYCKIEYIRVTRPDAAEFVECFIPILIDIMSTVKLLNLLINTRTIKRMLDQVTSDDDWSSDSKEYLIMQHYKRSVHKMTAIWTTIVYTTLILYNAMPVLPQIIGNLENQTRELPSPVYYHVETDDYYYPIFAHGFLAGFMFTTGIVAADTIFVLLVQHACALFDIVGHRLKSAVTESGEYTLKEPGKRDDATYNNFSDCVERHVKAIEFSGLVESSHRTSFLLVVTVNMLIISFTGAQMVNNMDEVHLLFRQGALIVSVMTHLFIENYYAQQLLDHSFSAYKNILESKWYRSSLRTKRLLILFVSQSVEPTVLTIGGLYVMSMENFTWVLRTSASYFTVLLSMQ